MLNESSAYSLGIDIGGTKISTAVVNIKGEIITKTRIPTNAEKGVSEMVKRVVNAAEKTLQSSNLEKNKICGVGIGVPGPVDYEKGVLIFAPNLSGWRNVPFKKMIQQRINLPVYLENDANAAALGEKLFGSGRDVNNLVYITISTGIGAGVIINGKLYQGSTGTAGEVGHMTIDINGPLCECGNRGCFEALASGNAVAREMREMLSSGKSSVITKWVEEIKEVKAEHVFKAAREGDVSAKKIVEKTCRYLAAGIGNVINLLNPELIIIGGGVSNAWDVIRGPVMKELKKRAFKPNLDAVKVICSKMGDDIGVLGAAALGFMNSKSFHNRCF